MKKIVVLGLSGSIGTQTWNVIKSHPEEFELVGFSVGRNLAIIDEVIINSNVSSICVQEEADKITLEAKYPHINVYSGASGLLSLVSMKDVDIVVNALVGFVGLSPTMKAISEGKDIALANKETLVVAGKFVTEACVKHNVKLLPIDSEHSAIFQALQGNRHVDVNKLIITASGGSFRDKTREQLKGVTKEAALAHPNWSMGPKITIDSATMVNKGLEVIEAHWLFNIPFEKIEVLLHRESVVHSMVEYIDNSIIAQLGTPDMRLAIQYALSYPKRLKLLDSKTLDLTMIKHLSFEKIDFERFPLLALAYEVGKRQGNLPTIYNSANEAAVELFLAGTISFLEIEQLIFEACEEIAYQEVVTLEDIYKADQEARAYVYKKVKEL